MTSACAQKKENLKFMLSNRHEVPPISVIEESYGDKEQLISDLMQLRLTDSPPFVALRAEELLIEFSDRDDVINVLEEDLVNPERKGLARVIIRSLHKIKDENAKLRLSKSSAKLIKEEPYFSSLKEYMLESPDPLVKKVFSE